MNRRMVEIALQTLHEADGVLWLLDSRERIGPEEERIAASLGKARDSESDSAQQDRSRRQRQIAAADATLLGTLAR